MQFRMDGAKPTHQSPQRGTDRLMWITRDRMFYAGLLGEMTERTMGSVTAYVSVAGSIQVSVGGGEWQTSEMAVVPPYVPHRVLSESRLINMVQIEAETVDLAALPPFLHGSGAVEDPRFAQRVRQRQRELSARGRDTGLVSLDFDDFFFGHRIPRKPIDPRIGAVLDRIKWDPSAPASAQDCAESAHLSFSRFLHLFKHEVGASFRSFRTWKRARSLLHWVNRKANLAKLALDVGYPDSTHFSHSIRLAYGLKPRDIFAGSRRLAVYAHALSPEWAAGAR
jgi:AraC-like DNA-binding protein